MWIKFQVWRARRNARLLSKYTGFTVVAMVGKAPVGEYVHGRRK